MGIGGFGVNKESFYGLVSPLKILFPEEGSYLRNALLFSVLYPLFWIICFSSAFLLALFFGISSTPLFWVQSSLHASVPAALYILVLLVFVILLIPLYFIFLLNFFTQKFLGKNILGEKFRAYVITASELVAKAELEKGAQRMKAPEYEEKARLEKKKVLIGKYSSVMPFIDGFIRRIPETGSSAGDIRERTLIIPYFAELNSSIWRFEPVYSRAIASKGG